MIWMIATLASFLARLSFAAESSVSGRWAPQAVSNKGARTVAIAARVLSFMVPRKLVRLLRYLRFNRFIRS